MLIRPEIHIETDADSNRVLIEQDVQPPGRLGIHIALQAYAVL